MYRKICLIFLIVTTFFSMANFKNPTNYGPYKIEFLKLETCKGPKRDDCGKISISNTHNMSNILFVSDISKDCPVKHAKISVGSIQKANITKKLWSYQIDCPCQHFLLGPLLTTSFNVTSNCRIIKGRYEVQINMNEMSKKFLGPSFFYDTFLFKAIAFNSDSNFFCVSTAMRTLKV